MHHIFQNCTFSLILLLFACNCSLPEKKKSIDSISIKQETIKVTTANVKDSLLLSSFAENISFIKLNEHDINNSKIRKILFTEKHIIVLWDNSKNLILYSRKGEIESILSQLVHFNCLSKISDIFYDLNNNQLHVLCEDGTIVIINVNNDNNIFVSDIKYLNTYSANSLLKLPDSDSYGVSLYNSDVDFLITDKHTQNNLSSSKNQLEYKVGTKLSKNILLRNPIIYDTHSHFYLKYGNDTIYMIISDSLVPYLIFDLNELVNINRRNKGLPLTSESNLLYTVELFFYMGGSFYVKTVVNSTPYYIFRNKKNQTIVLQATDFYNDVFGTSRFNCIAVDPKSNSFVFSISSLFLTKFLMDSYIPLNEKYKTTINNLLDHNKEESIILVLVNY